MDLVLMNLKCVFYNPLFLPVKIAGSPIEKGRGELVLAASSARRSQTSLGYTQLIISAPETQREIKACFSRIADFLRPKYFRTKSTRPSTEISSIYMNYFYT